MDGTHSLPLLGAPLSGWQQFFPFFDERGRPSLKGVERTGEVSFRLSFERLRDLFNGVPGLDYRADGGLTIHLGGEFHFCFERRLLRWVSGTRSAELACADIDYQYISQMHALHLTREQWGATLPSFLRVGADASLELLLPPWVKFNADGSLPMSALKAPFFRHRYSVDLWARPELVPQLGPEGDCPVGEVLAELAPDLALVEGKLIFRPTRWQLCEDWLFFHEPDSWKAWPLGARPCGPERYALALGPHCLFDPLEEKLELSPEAGRSRSWRQRRSPLPRRSGGGQWNWALKPLPPLVKSFAPPATAGPWPLPPQAEYRAQGHLLSLPWSSPLGLRAYYTWPTPVELWEEELLLPLPETLIFDHSERALVGDFPAWWESWNAPTPEVDLTWWRDFSHAGPSLYPLDEEHAWAGASGLAVGDILFAPVSAESLALKLISLFASEVVQVERGELQLNLAELKKNPAWRAQWVALVELASQGIDPELRALALSEHPQQLLPPWFCEALFGLTQGPQGLGRPLGRVLARVGEHHPPGVLLQTRWLSWSQVSCFEDFILQGPAAPRALTIWPDEASEWQLRSEQVAQVRENCLILNTARLDQSLRALCAHFGERSEIPLDQKIEWDPQGQRLLLAPSFFHSLLELLENPRAPLPAPSWQLLVDLTDPALEGAPGLGQLRFPSSHLRRLVPASWAQLWELTPQGELLLLVQSAERLGAGEWWQRHHLSRGPAVRDGERTLRVPRELAAELLPAGLDFDQYGHWLLTLPDNVLWVDEGVLVPRETELLAPPAWWRPPQVIYL